MGDIVRVTVSLVDVEQGQINFTLEGSQKNPTATQKKQKSPSGAIQGRKNMKQAEVRKSHSAKKQHGSEKKSNRPAAPVKNQNPLQEKRQEERTADRYDSGYTPRPRYSSLSDYLDTRKKGSNEEKSQTKSSFGSSQNRKGPEKRRSTENDSGGVRKARPQKSRRKNKSR